MKFLKTKINTAIAIAALSVGLAACSKDAKEAVHNIKEGPDLQGSFNDACSTSKIANASELIRLNFQGNSYTRSQIFYGEPNCAKEIGRIEYKGEFKVGNDVVDGENQGGKLDLNIQDVKVKVSSDSLAQTLNLMNYCGHNDFATGKEVTITGKQTQGLCPLENVPSQLYTTYRVEKDNLYLSDTDITTMTSDPSRRSDKVIYERVYRKGDVVQENNQPATPAPATSTAPTTKAPGGPVLQPTKPAPTAPAPTTPAQPTPPPTPEEGTRL